VLDLGFVRELVRDRYAAGGRPGLDPVVCFQLQLILFFEGLRSERKLLETASRHLAHRWYLGYALDEPLPDHSTLSRIRARLGRPVFQRFFEHVVGLCQEAGLVWGRELFFDATKVRANADVDSLVPRLSRVVGDHLEALFPPVADPHAPAPGPPPAATEAAAGAPAVVMLPPADRAAPAAERRPWSLLDTGRLDPARPASGSYRRLSDARVSRTDPDAALLRVGGQACLGSHDHYVVDGGKARVILAALVTPADVMENQPLLDPLRRVRFRWRVHPKRAGGGHDLRHGGEHPRPGGRRQPRLRPPARLGPAHRLLRPLPLRLRPRAGRVPLPRRPRPAPTHSVVPDPGVGLPRPRAHLSRLSGEGRLHGKPARPLPDPLVPRGVPRPRPRLPRDRVLQEGDAQAGGLGGAPVR
jgi:transposase